MKGQTATAREIKARWAFSEVLSDRFGTPYSAVLPQPLYNQVTAGCNFSDIQESYWDNPHPRPQHCSQCSSMPLFFARAHLHQRSCMPSNSIFLGRDGLTSSEPTKAPEKHAHTRTPAR
jgi:hypothetical protein